MDVDLGDVLDLEKQFYDIGYRDGFEHGRVHGLIEGRSLGKEKGFEMWEEVGFYMGFATIWKAVLDSQTEKSSAALSHLAHLLELAESFPTANRSTPIQ
ncbi:10941_t:CDS:2, partial [Acaulospora colombiana]